MVRRVVLVLVMAAVLAGCSGSTSALPPGWKVVSYNHIGIDVPASWKVEPFPNCPPQVPTVLLGTGSSDLMCSRANTFAAVVELGVPVPLPPPHVDGVDVIGPVHEDINGLRAVVTSFIHKGLCADRPVTVTGESVIFPARRTNVVVTAAESTSCPGGAPGRAGEIVNTIHAVS